MFRTEATLGLIGSILAIVAVLLILIVGLIVDLLTADLSHAVTELTENSATGEVTMEYTQYGGAAGSLIAVVIIGLVLMIASVVFGFIGTSKLRADNKKGGLLLIIAGALALVSLFLGGFYGIVTVVLFLIAGIMAMAKKDTAAT